MEFDSRDSSIKQKIKLLYIRTCDAAMAIFYTYFSVCINSSQVIPVEAKLGIPNITFFLCKLIPYHLWFNIKNI